MLCKPASLLEYRKFSGHDAQCNFTFEEKIRRCMKANKVSHIDQTTKLREQLSGHPLALVPESIEDIEKAISALKSRYGDKEQVLALRVSELKKLGPLPEKLFLRSHGLYLIALQTPGRRLSLSSKGSVSRSLARSLTRRSA